MPDKWKHDGEIDEEQYLCLRCYIAVWQDMKDNPMTEKDMEKLKEHGEKLRENAKKLHGED